MVQTKNGRQPVRQEINLIQQQRLHKLARKSATLGVRTAITHSLLDGEGFQEAIRHEGELAFMLQQATMNFLAQFPVVNYPVLTETELFKPVRVATIPARTKPFGVAEFYRYKEGHRQVSETFADNLLIREWQMPLVAAERPYVALRLKKRALTKTIRMELPCKHLSTLEDVGFFLQAQRSHGSGFLLDEFSPWDGARGNIFLVEGKGDLIFAVEVTAASGYADFWSGDGWWRITESVLSDDDTRYWNEGYSFVCPGTAEIEPV